MTDATEHDGSTEPAPGNIREGGSGPDWRAELAQQSEHAAPGGDPDLVSLVQLANAYGIETHVILTLPGQSLSGTLVSGRTYFEGLAAAVLGDESDETMRGALAASYRRRGADFDGWGAVSALGALDPDGPDDDRLASMPTVAYVHLRDVEVVTWPSSGRLLPLWRGRLADIVGWSVGDFVEPRPGV